MMALNDDIDRIESALAQTQCQLCDYKDCRAYATAIVHENETIDRCLPGGEKTLRTLAEWTHQDPTPYLNKIRENTKAITQAVIREHECIGCTKCLDACPVDAIIGSGKQMHTVITDLCNGCELCIPPCPVDCIDLVPHSKYHNAHEIADQSQQRYKQHQARQQQKQEAKPLKKHSLDARKTEIQALLDRVKEKKGIHDEHSKT